MSEHHKQAEIDCRETQLGRAAGVLQGQIEKPALDLVVELFAQQVREPQSITGDFDQESELIKSARQVIAQFYGHPPDAVTLTTSELFVKRAMSNIRPGLSAGYCHAPEQPQEMRRFCDYATDWGYVTGLLSVPETQTRH